MVRKPRGRRGFTLLEVTVTVAIAVIITALAYTSLWRLRPRAQLANVAAELDSLLHGARLSAMANGKNVAVLFFPQYANGQGTGRVVVYQDGNYTLFSSAAAVNFEGYAPGSPAADTASEVLDTYDLPRGVVIGPPAGMGSSATLAAPLAGLDVTRACTFCGGLADGRGAVVFDPRGRATFYGQNAPVAQPPVGASVSLYASDVEGTRTIVITGATGALRVFNNG